MTEHWRAFFNAEPGAEVTVSEKKEEVQVEVRVCPALKHLRANGREIVPCFCQQCYFVSEAMAAPGAKTRDGPRGPSGVMAPSRPPSISRINPMRARLPPFDDYPRTVE